MSNNNASFGPMPRIVNSVIGRAEERGHDYFIMKDSVDLYIGQLVSLVTGTDAAPTGAVNGISTLADDDRIYGIVTGFVSKEGSFPLLDDMTRKGTITPSTAFAPVKYTASATNDDSNPSPDLELVEVLPILPGDTIEISLVSDDGTQYIDRGTTANSDKFGYFLSVNTTAPWALTESSVTNTAANKDFQIVKIKGSSPSSLTRVYAKLVRGYGQFQAPQ